MIVDVRIVIDLFPAPARRPVDEIGTGIEIHRGHADLGEAELVGAVEITLVGELVRLDLPALLRGDHRYDRVDRRLAEADIGYVVRMAPDISAVVVQVRGDPPRRERRIVRIIQ